MFYCYVIIARSLIITLSLHQVSVFDCYVTVARWYIENTSWKVRAYGFYSRVVKYHKTNERGFASEFYFIKQ